MKNAPIPIAEMVGGEVKQYNPADGAMHIKSARGHLVQLYGRIFGHGGFIHDAKLGNAFFGRWPWGDAASDSQAGEWAEQCFSQAVRDRRLTLPIRLERYDGVDQQREGKDFRCFCKYDVEVKADIPGGMCGSGNLFVQTHELHHDHEGRNTHRDVTS